MNGGLSVKVLVCTHNRDAHSLWFTRLSPLHFTCPIRSNGMMNNSSSLPSIYSHQKLEPLLYCHNHCCCLRWTLGSLYIFQSGAGQACLLITPTDKTRAWFMAMTEPFDCLCVCGAAIRKWSSQQKSNKEARSVHRSSHHNCGYLQIDIAVRSPDIFSLPCQMNQRLSSYYPPPHKATSNHPPALPLPLSLLSAWYGRANHASAYNLGGRAKWLNHMLFSCLFSCLCLISIMFAHLWLCEI